MIERRLRDRNADAASALWFGKLVAFSLLASTALYLVLTFAARA